MYGRWRRQRRSWFLVPASRRRNCRNGTARASHGWKDREQWQLHHPRPLVRRWPQGSVRSLRGRRCKAGRKGTDRQSDKQRPVGRWTHRYLSDRKRSEEHTSELQSLMRISNAVFCLKKKKNTTIKEKTPT